MSTNYYLYEKPKCPHCGHQPEPRHIGLSAVGWAFALHVYPDEGIVGLMDWTTRWKTGEIKDEYGRLLTAEEMHRIVAGRVAGVKHAEVDGRHCIATGLGTWDLCVGEYS